MSEDRQDKGSLDARRRELLARRLRQTRQSGENVPAPGIARAPGTEAPPASSEQIRLWFLERLFPGSPAYALHLAVHIDGALDTQHMADALGALASRHDALRTRFGHSDGEIVQIVAAEPQRDHAIEDLTGTPAPEREAAWRARALTALRSPFDLGAGPLLRTRLYILDRDRHVLLLVLHHIVADEWSLNVMLRELGALYEAQATGTRAALPPLALRYGDYAAWQRQRIARAPSGALDYWRGRLAGELPVIEMPTDYARPARQSFRGALCQRDLPAATAQGLASFAREHDATLFMTTLAAFVALLHRYSGQEDLLIGTPVANRGRPETENLVGLFLNTLPLRIRAAADERFPTLLARVRTETLGAISHQDVPLEEIVRELAPARDLSANPLFQILFVFETRPDEGLAISGADCQQERLDAGVAKFDLTLFVSTGSRGLRVAAEYASDLYERPTIEAMLAAYATLLAGLVAAPDSTLDALPLLDDEATAAIRAACTGAPVANPVPQSWLARFFDQLRERPAAVALEDPSGTLDYAALWRRANLVARRLNECGARAGACIGIYMERSNEQIVALLGVHLTGAAYVPLDPRYPAARTGAIVADLCRTQDAPPLILAQALHHGEPALAAGRVIDIGPLAGGSGDVPACASPTLTYPQPGSDEAAYVIYTSGSSGEPKGVVVTHGNLAYSNEARLQHYQTPAERFLLLSSFSFDSSVVGIFWTLACGGTLVLPAAGTERDPRVIAAAMADLRITETLLLPSVYEMLLELVDPERLHALRRVIVAGEAARRSLVRRHCELLPAVRLFNEYGPTESTVWATVQECGLEAEGPVPIGRPIPGCRVYPLDRSGRLVPPGMPGELCIAGPGVARGYLGLPQHTAAAFVPEPLAVNSGLAYRSGDRVRMRGDTLEFAGRIDEQIKIRGHRVEPAEIEAALAALPGIVEVAVLGMPGPGDAMRLVAYLVLGSDAQARAENFRARLRERLPEYMLPSAYVVLPALPRAPGGKIDRRHLPAPETPLTGAAPAQENEDETLAALRAIWSQLLGREVAAGDDFFDLGGHSLLGVSMMIEVERRLGADLPLAMLFETPVLGDFAGRVRDAGAAQHARQDRPGANHTEVNRHVIPIRREGSLPPLFCVHGGARMLARHLTPEQPVYLAYHDTHEDLAEEGSVERIARLYLEEMRRIQPDGPYYLLGFSFGGMIAWEIACRLRDAGDEVGMLALCDPPPLIGTTARGYRFRRKWQEFVSQRGIAGKLRYVLGEPLRIAARRINALGLRLLGTYYERLMRSWVFRPPLRLVLAGLGVALLLANAVLMNSPTWRPFAQALPPTAGSVLEGQFRASENAVHAVEIEVDRNLPAGRLEATVLARKIAPEMTLNWQVSTEGRPIVGGDASDYLYLDPGGRSLPGTVRRILLGTPFGHDRLYQLSMGLLGQRTVARGLGKFRAEAGQTYAIRVDVMEGLETIAAGEPRLVVRLGRRFFDRHYAATALVGYAGLVLAGLAALLALLARLRSRQTMPASLVAFRNLRHNLRLSDRFRYRSYPGEVDLILPDDGDVVVSHKAKAWKRIAEGGITVRVGAGIGRHLDLIHAERGRGVADIVAECLERRRR